MLVFTLIIGKILEGNHMSLITKKNSVHNGKQRTLFKLMLMAVSMNTDANFLMDGRSKSIILLTIKCMLVDRLNNARNLIAHTTTLNKIEDNLSINSSKSFPRIEELQFFKLRSINPYSLIFSLMFLVG